MTESQWAALSSTERQLLICALEGTSGLAWVDEVNENGEPVDLPAKVLSMVDRGWVTVHRIEPWTAPDGQKGIAYGPAIDRVALPEILADPATWESLYSTLWYGAITLWPTEAGWVVSTTPGRGEAPAVPAPWVVPDWKIADFERELGT